KRPTIAWKRLETERLDRAEGETLFASNGVGVALICGGVGYLFTPNLIGFEFEAAAVAMGLPDQYADAVEAAGLGEVWQRITDGYTERSPSGGLHCPWRTFAPVANERL